MFTGIIESLGQVTDIRQEGSNLTFHLNSPLAGELKVDQSLSHNGVCLTVTAVMGDSYSVTAVQETLSKTNLGQLKIGSRVNLERCMVANGRFDGHIVQGHVDQTGVCTEVQELDGSWLFDFSFDAFLGNILVEKGSICINGVSLTVFDVTDDTFRVTIIPYTYENTNFHELRAGSIINLEFDVLGKYVQRILGRSA
ncbi:riboflavin synthase [Persicitalea jodogahamensis]|uniref:Riboflavin synthase n=1 Tax=Persicitalea jodogahamensis TaxID=402147 RepID=A0A8J3D2I5_9BACT|nr:riboflavin synthase [Persicitalea jodogahamensis]GHB58701.1 riboflavin synthase subunit alpha [Persicitalea jodogahamensis]